MNATPDLSKLPSLMRYSAAAVYFEHDRKEMLPFVPLTAKKALEIGCGSGRFGRQIKKRQSMEYWGIELTEEAARAAEASLDRVFCGTVEQYYAALPDQSFDLLILNDVLEHLQDPYLVLAHLLRKLTPDGVVVASIPNVLFIKNIVHLLVKKDWLYEDSGIRDRTHLRFFTRKSAIRMFEELGL